MSSFFMVPLRITPCSVLLMNFISQAVSLLLSHFLWSTPHFRNIRLALLRSYTGVFGRVSALILVLTSFMIPIVLYIL